MEDKKEKIASFAANVVFGSIDDAKCNQHRNVISEETDSQECQKCKTIKERVESYNAHNCSFTCHKKKKIIIIKEYEGHGRLDKTDQVDAEAIQISKCRFNFPSFPLDQTVFIEGRTKENNPQDEYLRKQEEFKHIESKKDF